MIDSREVLEWCERLGVAPDQVRRDHLVSHILASLPLLDVSDVIFYGGTALSRTLLDESRVSEDIDLLHVDPESALEALAAVVPLALRRDFPRSEFDDPSRNHDTWTTNLKCDDLRVRVQVTRPAANDPWTVANHNVALRYSDVESQVDLLVPTPEAFVAMKGLAWHDRRAPRDLFDLAGLARRGYFTEHAERLIKDKASHGWILADFERLPRSTVRDWEAQLAHQMRVLPAPAELAEEVLSAIRRSRVT